jgi:elongation factor Ts
MMECKKALSSPDVDGDVDKATEWLRKHGSAKVLSKVSGREANEGLVGMSVAPSGNAACVVRVSSETDFASRSDVLSKFVQEVADAASSSSSSSASNDDGSNDVIDVSALLSMTAIDGRSLDDKLKDAILSIRENIRVESIVRTRASSDRSILAGYVHGRSSPTSSCGSAASIVELVPIVDDGGSAAANEGAAREAARRLAMHVVAASPRYCTVDDVPTDVTETEREIYAEKARGDGGGKGGKKSPEIVDRIVTGQLRKFYEGNCLSEQMHMVEEGNPRVSKYLADMGYAVRSFALVRMGG